MFFSKQREKGNLNLAKLDVKDNKENLEDNDPENEPENKCIKHPENQLIYFCKNCNNKPPVNSYTNKHPVDEQSKTKKEKI